MLGFASIEMACAYIGCVFAALFCIIYGLIMWNKDEEPTGKEFKARMEWERGGKAMEDKLL
ncbi:MAG: hypothetical protein JRI46_09570 [Deltaproteobacteria bacterium]|nr:hypothetical protein [Deltaproteobacteria bacterium]